MAGPLPPIIPRFSVSPLNGSFKNRLNSENACANSGSFKQADRVGRAHVGYAQDGGNKLPYSAPTWLTYRRHFVVIPSAPRHGPTLLCSIAMRSNFCILNPSPN